MQKLLILCDALVPPARVPRVTSLCKYIDKDMWAPMLFTEQSLNDKYEFDACPTYRMQYQRDGKIKQTIQWFLQFLFQDKDYKLAKYIEHTVNVADFDLIFCSSFNLFPLTAAAHLSSKYKKPLVVDLRDIAEQWGTKSYFAHKASNIKAINNFILGVIEKRRIKQRNKAIKKSVAVTTISQWHKDFLSKISTNTHLIFNGYDKNVFYPQIIKSQYFEIIYTGRIYDLQFRNPNLLFAAIKELDEEEKITAGNVKISWYVEPDIQPLLKETTQKYGIEKYNEINGYVPTSEIPELLNRASINLLLTNKSTKEGLHGIMTTKFFEALGVEKPILCVRSDEDCLAKTISETEAGLAATNVEEVKQFIMTHYNRWKQQGYTHVDVKGKERFSRQEQAKQFMEIFNSAIQPE